MTQCKRFWHVTIFLLLCIGCGSGLLRRKRFCMILIGEYPVGEYSSIEFLTAANRAQSKNDQTNRRQEGENPHITTNGLTHTPRSAKLDINHPPNSPQIKYRSQQPTSNLFVSFQQQSYSPWQARMFNCKHRRMFLSFYEVSPWLATSFAVLLKCRARRNPTQSCVGENVPCVSFLLDTVFTELTHL